MTWKIGAQPINWINDDFRDLGADTTLETALGEMRDAGYAGSELGHRFPDDAKVIVQLLKQFDLRLVSGWHSTYFASNAHDAEVASFDRHMEKLRACGCDVVIVAECTHAIHSDGSKRLRFAPGLELLDDNGRDRLFFGLDRIAKRAAAKGMKVAYHPHMGTVIQDASDVDALMKQTRDLGLLLDTGHLKFAGSDPLAVAKQYASRIVHVHAKNVRQRVVDTARVEGWSFERAVRNGVFTVPGDPEGTIQYAPIFDVLARAGVKGWIVVEAEQDPKRANPLAFAKMGRAELRRIVGA
jgi:inosose dehydratase